MESFSFHTLGNIGIVLSNHISSLILFRSGFHLAIIRRGLGGVWQEKYACNVCEDVANCRASVKKHLKTAH